MSIRTLTIDEMLEMPDGSEAVLLKEWRGYEAGTTLKRRKAYRDDHLSVAFFYNATGFDFFEEGEVGVVEPTISIHALQPTHTGEAGCANEEIGNPKVGAASKKYSLRYMPLSANIEANRALENGAEKYGLCNWRDTNVKASVYIDAALRHIAQWQEGQENASDSTVHNLGHAMASLAIIIDAQAQGVLIDDRPTASKDTDNLLLRSA